MEKKEIWHQAEKELQQAEEELVEKKHSKVRRFGKEDMWLKETARFILGEEFRKIEGEKKEVKEERREKHFYEDFEKLSKEARELYKLKWKNLIQALREKHDIDDRLNLIEFALSEERKKIREESRSWVPEMRTPLIEEFYRQKRRLESSREKLKALSPEAYIALHLGEYKRQIKNIKEGRLMETNYVKQMEDWTLDKMEEGSPVFFHGHLGGGKTEFAIHIATERMKRLHVNRELKTWIEKEQKANKVPTPDEIARHYRQIYERYTREIHQQKSEVLEKVSPYFIAGSKDFSLEDLYTEKVLEVKNIFNTFDVLGHSEKIDEVMKKWLEQHKKELSQLSPEEQQKRTEMQAQRILELYIRQHEGFGVLVKKVEKELLKAIQEGKPIIIDEINAIPATLLMSMNSILTTRPGKLAYVPGKGQVKVKEGFSIIMTGNLNTAPLAEYIGTEELNPAFLSRLSVKEYDYLPQETSGNVFEQKEPQKNELFQVAIAYLSNEDGSLRIPEGSLNKLFALCQLARVTQRVFSGKWRESDVVQEPGVSMAEEPKLEKAVISVRNIVNILNEWGKGLEKDLDKALWDGFIAGITDPKDQNFIFAKAREFGFFRGEFWKDVSWSDIKDRQIILSWEDVSNVPEKEYQRVHKLSPLKPYSPREVIEMLYGPAPERIKFPDVDLEKLAAQEKVITPEDIEKVGKVKDFVEDNENWLGGIKYALDKEGCHQ